MMTRTNMHPAGVRLLAVVALTALGCGGSTEPADLSTPASVVLAVDTFTTFPGAGWRRFVPAATVYNSAHQVLDRGVSWSSADPSIASLEDGERSIRGNAEGSTVITATAGSASATLRVTIAHEHVAGVQMDQENPTYMYGADSLQFAASAVGPGDDVLPDRPVTFISHQPDVATVTPMGFVRITGSGTARILATSEGITDSVTIFADARRVARITIDPPSATLPVGGNQDFSIHMFDASDTDLGNRPRIFVASDTTVALAAYSSVVGLKVGTAVITLTSGTVTMHIPITVVAAP